MVKVVNVVALYYFQIILGLKNPVIDEIVRPMICRPDISRRNKAPTIAI